MKRDHLITDFKGADSSVNCRFVDGLRWLTGGLAIPLPDTLELKWKALAVILFDTCCTARLQSRWCNTQTNCKCSWDCRTCCMYCDLKWLHAALLINSIQDYFYSAFYDTTVAKQLHRKLSFNNRFIYCRSLIYSTYGKIWLILYAVWGLAFSEGVVIVSSQVFGHLRSFKGWIQTEACVIPSYHGMLIQRNK